MRSTSFGPFVDQIGLYPGAGASGWSYKVNGASPPVGADQATLKDGDTVLWYWSTFTEQGGSPTLLLRKRKARNCYTVVSQNDQGVSTPAAGARLLVDGRSVKTKAGRGCVGKHRGLVRATLAERGALERAQVKRALLAALALVLLPGCGHERTGSGSATLWVTRDRGASVLAVRTVPAGLTAMQALDRELDVKTRYSGRFVQSIEGIDGDASKQRDWFWFLNGIEADRSAADYRLHAGDVEWWDFRSWRGADARAGGRRRVPRAVPARLRGPRAPRRGPVRGGPGRRRPRDRSPAARHIRRASLGHASRGRECLLHSKMAADRFTASLRDSGDAGSPVRFVFAGDAQALAKHPDRFRYRYQVP